MNVPTPTVIRYEGLCAEKTSSTPSPHVAWSKYKAFVDFVASLGLQRFVADELLFLGELNAKGRCCGLNDYPPEDLWRNIAPTIALLDRLSGELGLPIYILSAYRSPTYNKCIEGAATNSFHMHYRAIDFFCDTGSPADWATRLRRYRSDGLFCGGIGTYNLFVHVDTGGVNDDWTE